MRRLGAAVPRNYYRRTVTQYVALTHCGEVHAPQKSAIDFDRATAPPTAES